MTFEYKGEHGRLSSFSISKEGKRPYYITFEGALRPYGVLPLVVDLYNRRCNSFVIENYKVNSPISNKLIIKINVKEFINVECGCWCNNPELPDYVGVTDRDYFSDHNQPIIFHNTIVKFNNENISTTGITINLLPDRTLTFDKLLNGLNCDNGTLSIFLHKVDGSIFYGKFVIGISKINDLTWKIESFEYKPREVL